MNNSTNKRINDTIIRSIKRCGAGKLLIFALAISQLAGCVKDELSRTPHPDRGAVQGITDWSAASSDAVLPSSYVLRIGTEEQTVSGVTNTFGTLLAPGKQDLLVYHQTEGITVSGTTATVNALADGTLEPLPGYLFSAEEELAVVADDTLRVNIVMKQHTRSLTLTLQLKAADTARLSSWSTTLTGIAPARDLREGAIASTGGKSIAPVFKFEQGGGKQRSGEAPKLVARLRLMGVMPGEKQMLNIHVILTDGYEETIPTDLTEELKNFNAGTQPLPLDATLALPVAAEVGGSISTWEEKDLEVDAEME